MNTQKIKKALLLAVAGGFVWWAWKSPAQDAAVASAPMSYGVTQVIQLEQAKIGDDTIIAYIRNSGTVYGLNAAQIIYLRQQGVSDAVLTAMLTQPKADPAIANEPPASAPPPVVSTPAPNSIAPTVTAPPTVTYVESAPTTYYYPYDYSYGYPYYYGWPAVSLGWAWWGGGWHWGGGGWHGGGWHSAGWHGGWGGGWHGGGGWHR